MRGFWTAILSIALFFGCSSCASSQLQPNGDIQQDITILRDQQANSLARLSAFRTVVKHFERRALWALCDATEWAEVIPANYVQTAGPATMFAPFQDLFAGGIVVLTLDLAGEDVFGEQSVYIQLCGEVTIEEFRDYLFGEQTAPAAIRIIEVSWSTVLE